MKRLLCFLIALPAIAFSQNLIQNGSLESWDDMLLTPLDWTVEGSVTEDNIEFTEGTSSALLVNGATGPKLIATNYTLEVGKTYQLSFDYKVKTANPSFGQQVIGYAYGGADFTPNTNGSRIPQNFDWGTVTREITPTQTESWYLEISLFSFIGDAFEVYIDNVQVVETGTTAQRDALVALYNATNGDSWTNSWDITGDMSSWNGVTLDASGNVSSLIVSINGLSGTIPSEIGTLTSLTKLHLGYNQLTGSIPAEIGNLTQLTELFLQQNELSGTIPMEVFNLTNLEILVLSENQLTGEIPTQIGNLTKLTFLDLKYNQFYGSIPNSLENLTDIYFLNLYRNSFSGEVLTIVDNLTSLTTLNLGSNFFSGTIPTTIGNLTLLESLDLTTNSFSGEIPAEIGNLTNLQSLYLGTNRFSGTIPSQIGNLSNLTAIAMPNNRLSGTIPTGIGSLTSLGSINFENNQLSGSVPTLIKDLPSLSNFNIGTNNFVFEDFESDFTALVAKGFIYAPQANVDATEAVEANAGDNVTLTVTGTQSPNNVYQWYKDGLVLGGETNASLVLSNIGNSDFGAYHCVITNTNVSSLTLQKNTVTVINPIPQSEIDALIALYNATDGANWTNTWDLNANAGTWYGVTFNTSGYVSSIDLRSNNLIGTLPPEIGNFPFLEKLNLSSNFISGSLPYEIGNLGNLQELNLGTNQFSGTIPPEIGSLSNLTRLSLYLNQLTGQIPVAMGNLSSLQDLTLASNQLTGEIPLEFENITNLIQIDLSQNQLSGTINTLMKLPNLWAIDLRVNNFTGEIPAEIGNLSQLSILQIFSNQFSGELPAELFSLTNLQHISLSNNLFSGVIPSSISNLSSLSSLQINNNNFSGSLPVEIANISSLSSLSISNNNFSGVIPSGIKNLTNLSNFNIANNNFVFEDFENEFNDYNALNNFSYSPQANVDAQETIEVILGDNITLTVAGTQSANNSYQWRKDGIDLPGETNSSIVLSNLSNAELGLYDCIITNSNVPSLILQRHSINLINPIPQSEKDNLIAFYNATGGPSWTNTWDLNGNPSSWYGITYNTNGRVNTIDLRDNNLTGNLPPEIGSFSELETLFLLINQIGGAIPPEIGNLTNLKRLSFSSNQLSGEIPIEIGNMASLERFFVNDNQLTGTIPSAFGNLVNLEALSLTGNQFFGNIPTAIGNLTNLTFLNLSKNQLAGPVPTEIGNLTILEQLYLFDNQLEGSIPTQFANLTSLRSLYLHQNQLSGVIPTGIKNITSLQVFDISENKFVFEDFENDFTAYNGLNTFNFAPQAKVDESASIDLVEGGEVTFTVLGTQTANNSYQWRKNGVEIFGETNTTLTLTNTSTADLGVYDCLITNSNVPGLTIEKNGVEITTNVIRAQKEALIALYNATDGPNWTNTWDLNADISTWHGVALDASRNVVGLYLDDNNLNGSLPTQIGDLSFLSNLSLNSNQLSGDIPIEIGNLTELLGLSLAQNSLNGNIPNEIGNLIKLQTLIIDGNNFTGEIPVQIGNLTDLRSIELSFNQLTGTIPSTFGNFTNLVSLEMSANQLEGALPIELGNLPNLQVLQLYNNQLTGEIPAELGNLSNLGVLNLANNQLSGLIPNQLSNLTTLWSFNLSGNQLFGTIPSGIKDLTALSGFHIENNKFVFEDLENDYTALVAIGMTYNPQDLIDNAETLFVVEGGDITLTVNATNSLNNSYQWQKNGSDIPGATTKDLIISAATFNDAAEYTCTVTNSIITDLVLMRNPITLNVTQQDADFDGIADDIDQCPNTPLGAAVDNNGCASSQLDDDNDGVTNDLDKCPNTATGETVDSNGCSQNELDDDNDGVNNTLDQCANTPAGDIVDSNGCSTSQVVDIVPGDIQIEVIGTSCADRANGQIKVVFKKDYVYNITVVNSDQSSTTFDNVNASTEFIIPGLDIGNHSVCISIPSEPLFEQQCFEATVNAPVNLKVAENSIDQKTANYTVSGSTYYSVTVNANVYEFNFEDTSEKQISFDLQSGVNNVEIKTDKACQGKFNKTINAGELSFYPVPVNAELNISGLDGTETIIRVTNLTGSVVYSKTIEGKSQHIIPMHNMAAGMYLVTITNATQSINSKIFKK